MRNQSLGDEAVQEEQPEARFSPHLEPIEEETTTTLESSSLMTKEQCVPKLEGTPGERF